MLKKSVVIANRHSTSISLEPEFMEELEAIARQKGLSVTRKLSPGFIFTNFAEKDNILSPPMKAVHQ